MNERILIIEDDQAILKLLQRGLAYEGYTVDTATDGRTGLILARDHTPDLVILDWMLPGMSGASLAKALRQDERTRQIPIILLTARAAEQDKIAGLEAGADEVAVRPRVDTGRGVDAGHAGGAGARGGAVPVRRAGGQPVLDRLGPHRARAGGLPRGGGAAARQGHLGARAGQRARRAGARPGAGRDGGARGGWGGEVAWSGAGGREQAAVAESPWTGRRWGV